MMNYFIIAGLCVVSGATFAKGLEFQHYPAKAYTGQPAKIQLLRTPILSVLHLEDLAKSLPTLLGTM